jgi:hypothetical protein
VESTRSYRQGIVTTTGNDFTSISLGVDVSVEGLATKLLKRQ